MTHRDVLKKVRDELRERATACEDVAESEGDGYTAEAKQAISEEAVWLNALLMRINDHFNDT